MRLAYAVATSVLLAAPAAAQSDTRAPLDVARVLAARYPESPGMSYISGLAWGGALRLAALTGESRWFEKPRADMQPFVDGERPAIAEPYALTSLAGHIGFFDWGVYDRNAPGLALALDAADFIISEHPDSTVRFGRGWTDDMFMASALLSRVGAFTEEPHFADVVGRMLTTYAARLQRDDGLFIHGTDGPHAWGRGNGFAALGLTEALTYMEEALAERDAILASYQRLMDALLPLQGEDGSWRNVLDQPTAYPELTVTAIMLTAMARGVRLGWLDAERFTPAIERAWQAVLARVNADGTLRDVCTSTGAQATLEYYMTRPVVNGADDRGGAIVLMAALEMDMLGRPEH
ncbi:MAG: glycoside hydrolase family 88 protein [Gemmatimonadales bacterium]